MARIYITFPLHRDTVELLGLIENKVIQFDNAHLFYQPNVGLQQGWRKNNIMHLTMKESIKSFKPDVVVIGNNTIPESAIRAWGKSLLDKTAPRRVEPMIIRRGTELGGIPVELAKAYGIELKNTPGINSPYVARHMLQQLDFTSSTPGETIAVVGAGDIGLPIIKAAVKNGLNIKVISDSLMSHSDVKRRNQKIDYIQSFLEKNRIENANISYHSSLESTLDSANYIAISVPWWLKKEQRHNEDMIGVSAIKKAALGAIIVSASNPRVFSEDALSWMNQKILGKQIKKVRIDTGHSYAAEVYERYNCKAIDAQAGKAFYCKDGLTRLDRALLNVIFKHSGLPTTKLLMTIPRPHDDMDIESYIVNPQHFYDTEKVYANYARQLLNNSNRVGPLKSNSFDAA